MIRKILLLCVLMSLSGATQAQENTVRVPNSSFESGTNSPTGWTVGGEGGQTAWENTGRTGKRSVSVAATKSESALYWMCRDLKLEAGQIYRFSFWSKAQNSSGGCIISGPGANNCDFPFSPQWSQSSFVFQATTGAGDQYLRIGQWNGTGKVWFDDVSLARVTPLHALTSLHESALQSTLALGNGESIGAGRYQFEAPLQVSNAARPLQSATARFNSNRWVFDGDSHLTYRHDLGGIQQRSARVTANINYYRGGRLIVEASRDGQSWTTVGELQKQGTLEAEVPASLFPCKVLWTRLRSTVAASGTNDSNPGSLQINRYRYEATIENPTLQRKGDTHFLEELSSDKKLRVEVQTMGDLRPGANNMARFVVHNLTSQAVVALATLQVYASGAPRSAVTAPSRRLVLKPGATAVQMPVPLGAAAGDFYATLKIACGRTAPSYANSVDFSVPALYAADYGYRVGAATDVWACDGAQKISRERPAPHVSRAAIEIRAARNEYEPFQIVARPTRDVKNLRVSVSNLRAAGGATLASKYFNVCEVAYVEVQQPTDKIGTIGMWPDPLPPHTKAIDVAGGRNQAFWITLHVPESAKPGAYSGTVKMSGVNWTRNIPLRVVVRPFALPRETHVQSGFGLDWSMVKRYHNLDTNEEVARVMEKYYENFAAHRIAPYDPVYGASIGVDWGLDQASWTGGTMDETNPFGGKRSLRVEDNSDKSNFAATTAAKVAVQSGRTYTLKWAARTAQANHPYLVSIASHDANGTWLSGRNIDVRRIGQTSWQQESFEFSPPAQASLVQVNLRATPWTDKGEQTGVAWFDDVQLVSPEGKNLLSDGSFERVLQVSASQVKLDFSRFDPAAERAFNVHRFTAWRLPIVGIGSGTFESRREGQIGTFKEGSPEYETLLGSYLKQLQDHLEQKGWLARAYTYWFDEPEPKDYAFVRATNARIQKYAPKLTRLLTEQPEAELAGSVDLWCPVTYTFDARQAQARRKAGDRFWWYVCTGPKAPYATLFIDHPAVELRTWLWQTWQNKVEGILVWEANYWTSAAAYPNALQNPWTDAMSWVSGPSMAPGARQGWGNGDGRFVYPPNRNPDANATDANATGATKTKYFEGPINSIRWEMLREGIEDYEYFWLLRDTLRRVRPLAKTAAQKTAVAQAEKLLQIPTTVTKNLTEFSRSSAPLMAHREKIAEAIVKLNALMRGAACAA